MPAGMLGLRDAQAHFDETQVKKWVVLTVDLAKHLGVVVIEDGNDSRLYRQVPVGRVSSFIA